MTQKERKRLLEVKKEIKKLNKIMDDASGILEAVNYLIQEINKTTKPPVTATEITAVLMLPATRSCMQTHIELLRDTNFFSEEYRGE